MIAEGRLEVEALRSKLPPNKDVFSGKVAYWTY